MFVTSASIIFILMPNMPKLLAVTFSLALVFSFVQSVPVGHAAVPTTGLAAHWSFDGVSAGTAFDELASTSDAVLVNGPATTTGQIGEALSFDGAGQYGTATAIDLSGSQAASVSFWLKDVTESDPASIGTILEFTDNLNNHFDGFGIFRDDTGECGTGGPILLTMRGNAGYNAACYDGSSVMLESGAWHQYVAVFDKSLPGDEADLYVDGTLLASSDRLLNLDNTDDFGSEDLYMMSRGGGTWFSAGSLDDVRVYNRALTAGEIGDIYNDGIALPPPPPPLPASLTVITAVVNDDGGTATSSDFSVDVTATNVSAPAFAGSASGVTVMFDAGAYEAAGTVSALYTLATSTDCTGTLSAGAAATCTITYDDIAPVAPPVPPAATSTPTVPAPAHHTGSIPPRFLMAATPAPADVPDTVSCALSGITLLRGSSGVEVEKLQRLLDQVNSAGLAVTGAFDDATEKAVRDLQTRYAAEILAPWGLSETSGVASLTTSHLLNKLGCGIGASLTAEQLSRIEEYKKNPTPGTEVGMASKPTQSAASSSASLDQGARSQVAAVADVPHGFFQKLLSFFKDLF
jgi:hypothetical protein